MPQPLTIAAVESPTEYNRFLGYETSPVVETTPLLGQGTRRIYDWWRRANRGAPPLKSAFDIVDHARLAPHIFVVDREQNGRFRFRLMGEEVVRMVGRSRAGDWVTGVHPDDRDDALERYYWSIVIARVPKRCFGTLAFAGKSHHRFESIDCPLADDQGEVVRILGLMEILPTSA
jgi:hypothetical protein